MMDDYLERHFAFEGCFNFRDIGGYLNKDGKRVKKVFTSEPEDKTE
jgi:hypothetical protein